MVHQLTELQDSLITEKNPTTKKQKYLGKRPPFVFRRLLHLNYIAEYVLENDTYVTGNIRENGRLSTYIRESCFLKGEIRLFST